MSKTQQTAGEKPRIGEQEVRRAAERLRLPVVQNPCPANGSTRRQEVKELLIQLEQRYPNLRQKIFGAMQRYPLAAWEPKGRYKRPKDEE